MTRRAALFRQADVTRALRAAAAAGMTVSRVEIDAEGKIILISSQPGPEDPATAAYSSWKSKSHAHAN